MIGWQLINAAIARGCHVGTPEIRARDRLPKLEHLPHPGGRWNLPAGIRIFNSHFSIFDFSSFDIHLSFIEIHFSSVHSSFFFVDGSVGRSSLTSRTNSDSETKSRKHERKMEKSILISGESTSRSTEHLASRFNWPGHSLVTRIYSSND